MRNLIVVFSTQLNVNMSCFDGFDKKHDRVLLCETYTDFDNVAHHQKKLVFMLSAMRHFAKELEAKNYKVKYITLDKTTKRQNLNYFVKESLKTNKFTKVILTKPNDYTQLQAVKEMTANLKTEVEIREDNSFLCTIDEFKEFAADKKNLRMEFFYREMRKKYNILMHKDLPIGGKWNFDALNRKVPSKGLDVPKPYTNKPDKITQDVIKLVNKTFPNNFGDIEPFYFAVTRRQAISALKKFIQERLPTFGDYQDAMLANEPWMYHSHISFYLNNSMLLPLECIQAAEQAYHDKHAPLNAVEGFIRQILGWREYVRGVYWIKMPKYATENFLKAKRKLPSFYWDAKTNMNCIKQCVQETQQNAYAHHIQRLMVLGNFALVAGLNPDEVNEWYHIVYADAYQWVELPNVTGMILFADGGYLASKPYAAGGNYINKMSNYCKDCIYKIKEKVGDDACPFNYLYWDFLIRNEKLLGKNQRLSMMYATLKKMPQAKKDAIVATSKKFLKSLD